MKRASICDQDGTELISVARDFVAGVDSTAYRESAKRYWAAQNPVASVRVLTHAEQSRAEWLALENTIEKQYQRLEEEQRSWDAKYTSALRKGRC